MNIRFSVVVFICILTMFFSCTPKQNGDMQVFDWSDFPAPLTLKGDSVAFDEMVMKPVIEQEVYDNSDYSIAGPIIDHRDGHVTIKMGKPTAAELLAMLEEVL